MPGQLDIPWEEIKEKYVSGVMSPDVIADTYNVKLGTLYKRAHRQGWTNPVRRAQAQTKAIVRKLVVESANKAKPAIEAAISQAVKAWTDKAHDVAGRIVARVSESANLAHQPEDLQRLAGALDRADTVGRRALGLDKEDLGPRLTNIAIGLVYAHAPSASAGLLMDYANQQPENVLDAEVVGETRT